jgi:maleate isomerase
MDGDLLRIGVLTPHAAAGPEAEFPDMAPGRLAISVARVRSPAVTVNPIGGPPAPLGARVLTDPPLLDDAAGKLAAVPVDVIGYASTSTGYAIGFDGETAMVDRLARSTGVPIAATGPSAVLALRVLGVERVALVDPPWFDDEINELGARYFRSQGLDVVSSASADLAPDPRLIEAAPVVEWTIRHVPDRAEAVYFGGNGFRVAAAIETLEDRLDRPVLTSNQVLLWRLLAVAGATFPVSGYGRLFAHRR